MGLLDEFEQALDGLFPESEKCDHCQQKNPKLEVKCSCGGFKLATCTVCVAKNREVVKASLVDHAISCSDGASILSALGF